MRSLRGRLILGTVLCSAAVFAVAGIGLYALIRASLQAEFDLALAAKAGGLAGLVEEDEGRVEMEMENAALPEFSRPDRPEYFELWLGNGRVVARSSSLKQSELSRIEASTKAPVFRAILLPDGRPGRSVAICFQPRAGNEDERPARAAVGPSAPLTLVVAAETARIDATLARIGLILIGVCVGSALLAAGVLAGTVQLALRPLRELAGRIAGLEAADLATRIDAAGAPAELAPVIGRLNELLERLAAAFARERSFTADVAHELRTPLAGLRSTLDVNLTRLREPEAYQAALADCLTITCQMQALVENILALTRLESGAVAVDTAPVQLKDLIAECWRPHADHARQRSLRVIAEYDQPVVVETDREKLRHVLTNVLENAVTYADTGGEVRIELHDADDGAVSIRVSNTGCTLSPADAERVFERFWRGDTARHDTGAHCGLGLPLSKRLMEVLGGSIHAECVTGGTFLVRICLPGIRRDGRNASNSMN